MFRILTIHSFFVLLSFNFFLINTEDISNIILRLNSQFSSLNEEPHLRHMLNNGGIFNCDSTYCSQISFLESQTKKNQIQKFPQIKALKSNSDYDLSNIIIVKIFSKYDFPLDSVNYKSGLNSISNIAYFQLYPFEDNIIKEDPISSSLIGYDHLLIYLPLYTSESLKNKYLSVSGQNPKDGIEHLKDYDIFDPDSKIYKDICYPITFTASSEDINGVDSLKNLDITLEQRKKYYFPGNLYLCPNGCTYQGIDKDTISSICKCNEEYFTAIEYGTNLANREFTNFAFDEKSFYESNKDIYFSTLNTLKCIKLPFTSSGFKNNYGSKGIILLAVVVIICFLILIFKGKKHLISVFELLCNSMPKNTKRYNNDIYEIKRGKKNKAITLRQNIGENSDDKMDVDVYQKNKANDDRKAEEKNQYINDIKQNPPKKKYSLIGDGITLDDEVKKEQKKKVIEDIKEEEKKEKIQIMKNNEDDLLKMKEQYENELRKLKERNEKDMKKLKKEKDKEIEKLKRDLENNKKPEIGLTINDYKTNETEIKGLYVSVPLDGLFTDQEINAMDLNQSLTYDKRGFLETYYSFINMKQPLFFLFNYYSKNKINNFQIKFNSLRIIIFCYEIMIYIFLYVISFGSESISKIFFGTFNLGKKCSLGMILSLPCMIIKSVMQYFIYNPLHQKIVIVKQKCYSYFIFEKDKVSNNESDNVLVKHNSHNVINSNMNFGQNEQNKKDILNNEFRGFIQEFSNYFKKKFLIFFIISIPVLFFEWMVVSSFCSVYKNSQIDFFASILVCYLFSNIYSFIYCFIPSFLRLCAIKSNSGLLFKIAEVAKMI